MRTSVLLLDGRLDEAEAQAEQTYAEGLRAQSWDAGAAHLLALSALRREQGRLAELEEDLIDAGSLYPGYRLFRCVLALVCLESGRAEDARASREIVHGGEETLPHDNGWAYGMTTLSEIVARTGDTDLAAILYDEMQPYAHLMATGGGEIGGGSLERSLGQVASVLGRTDERSASRRGAQRAPRVPGRHLGHPHRCGRRGRAAETRHRRGSASRRAAAAGRGRCEPAPEYLRKVDLAGGRIEVNWPVEPSEPPGGNPVPGADRRGDPVRRAGQSRGARVAGDRHRNPRAHTQDVHQTVDDRPYGGGPGMVMKPEPLLAAIGAARARLPAGSPRICLSAQGEPFSQALAQELAALPGLMLVAGRYEGVDERVIELGIDRELSVGDYVVSGGELPALVVIDAVARLLPGALGDARSAQDDSFSEGSQGLLDWPHYTRPEVFKGLSVPPVLLSGNHADIRRWRLAQAVTRTWRRRPDLIAARGLSSEASRLLNEFLAARAAGISD